MTVIDRDLVRAINSGRCFALIGSGPSCEMGVPSWSQLAEIVIREIESAQRADIAEESRALLAENEYTRIFSLAKKVLGRDHLLAVVRASLAGETEQGLVYQYAASWPFSCYLTTNFDDHLIRHLETLEIPFAVRRNSQEDMRTLRADSKNLVVKIHGDPTVPEDIVLTKEQYLDFQKGKVRRYWRDKIMSVLNMVDLVIIGYSASDPDFQDQLDRAKQIASPNHPVFLFAADLEPDQVGEYYRRFNIRIIPYRNLDGTHRELRRLLQRYNPFIAKRESPALGLDPVDESVATLAASVHLFTQLRLIDTDEVCIGQVYSSLVLQVLSQLPEKRNVSINALRTALAEKTFAASNVDPAAMHKALETLHSVGYISLSPDGTAVNLESTGREAIATVKAHRDLIREKFREACRLFLKRESPALEDESVHSVIDALQTGLVRAYEKRGMEIARSVFSGDVVDVSDATDVLETINCACSMIPGDDQRRAFADLMIEVVLRPGEEMRQFLAAISQGYFACHALGLDPRCSRERLDMARAKKWILDSSILLPILARNCLNHLYAEDLLERMGSLGLRCFTTERLFDEVQEHAWWAITNFAASAPDDPNLLQAAMAGPGYKQNLFLDGFVKWSLPQGDPSFRLYLSECLGSDYEKDLGGSIRSKIEEWGVEIMSFSQWPDFSQDLWPERDEVVGEIEQLRRRYGTYRRKSQCIAEAEVVLACEVDSAAFLSQSGVLNKLIRTRPRMTMKPEAMYRFLSLFSSVPADIDLLYECMIQDFYSAGFDIVNKEVISQFVRPMVRQARMQLDQERKNYEEALGQKRFVELRDDFERVPDEQKPFYSMQFAFYVAAEETRRREAAEARARRVEEIKHLTGDERNELIHLRAKRDEKRRREEKRRRRSRSQPKRKRKKKQ